MAGITVSELAVETRLLDQLTDLLAQARQVRPDRPPLSELLEQQAAICESLAQRRALRAQCLNAQGYGARDLLVALLAARPKSEHGSIVAAFSEFVSAAERAQAQIDINREFFSVALAAVEDALVSASPEAAPATYDIPGGRRRRGGSVMVSTDS